MRLGDALLCLKIGFAGTSAAVGATVLLGAEVGAAPAVLSTAGAVLTLADLTLTAMPRGRS